MPLLPAPGGIRLAAGVAFDSLVGPVPVIDAAGMLALGLAGSVHCGAMCGPVLAGCAQGGAGPARQVWLHAGRTLAYAGLGAVCGTVGALVDFGAGLAALPRIAGVIAGLAMVGLAIHQFGWIGAGAARTEAGARVGGLAPRFLLGRALFIPGNAGAFAVGAALGLLPCGLLYGAVALAAASADPARGAWLMLLFALGGVLPLAGLGHLFQIAWRRGAGSRLNRGAAILVLALGLGTIATRVAPVSGQQSHPSGMEHHHHHD